MGIFVHLFVYLIEKHYFCRMNSKPVFLKPIIILLLIATTIVSEARDKDEQTSLVLNRLFNYSLSIDSTIEGHTTTAYLKYKMKTERRNPTLYCAPHLYTLAKAENRSHFGEIYATLIFHEKRDNEVSVHAKSSTVRRQRTLMQNILCYLTPNLYSTTLISDHLLSPFNKKNKHYYKYHITYLSEDEAKLSFKPRFTNTQAVKGNAIIEVSTGRIIRTSFAGEYDMVSFETNLVMGEDDIESLHPLESEMKMKFSFLGNRIRGKYKARYGMPTIPQDSIIPQDDAREAIEEIRPFPLEEEEEAIYAKYDSVRMSRARDTTTTVSKKNFAKDILWDAIGDKILNRIRGNFGADNRGYYRLSPLFNPLYLSYSKHRGFTYRITLRAGYDINENSDLYTRTKIGYSHRLKQPFFNIPLTYTFDKEKNGYVKIQWRSGERVTSSTVEDKLKREHKDIINWDEMDLEYFRHLCLTLDANYDINKYLGFQMGLAFKRWTSIYEKDFHIVEKPTTYSKTAVTSEVTLRPIGYKGPIFTINYETTFKGRTEPGLNYEKWEFDCSYLRRMPCMRALSMRVGAGFYPTRTTNAYFLDFNNFRENNIPGGWQDDWSGEFELLHSNWYNSSKYYLRANVSYESPMLFLSCVPIVGTIIEKERVYLSVLKLSQIRNYFELGYSITNRLFSIGLFTSFREGHYESFGCEFGFELFNRW